jgi:rare lipoprotein A
MHKVVVACLALWLAACTAPRTAAPRSPTPRGGIRPAVGATQRGLATWYGGRFHGRLTASGERFDKHALTAAHLRLRFGTRVRVTHQRTGRAVVVRINDRGPYGNARRIIDLSEEAARRLGIIDEGVAPVTVEVLP